MKQFKHLGFNNMGKTTTNKKEQCNLYGVIKRYLYLIPLIGVLCTKNKRMSFSEEWTYFIYQWICSLLIPLFICIGLMYFNVL